MACVVNYGQQPPVLKCTICGGCDPFSLPLSISQVKAVIEVFQMKHAMCKIRDELRKAPKWSEVKS